jgi:TatD DNase family protein
MLVDTHCHLAPEYFADPVGVIARARDVGVGAFIAIGVGGGGATRFCVELAHEQSDVLATVGAHPHDASSLDAALEGTIRELAPDERVVAIGEIGLDYHYDHCPREVQRDVFRRLLELAREARKPIVVHTRSAADDTLAILEESGARDVGGVIHCFSEDRAFARRALDLGFYLSFSGIVTFKNARAVQEVASWAPAERILVETDSPYLAPVPHRGKPCEPAHVRVTAARLAELRGASFDDIARITTENAVHCFGPALAAALRIGKDGE